MSSRLHLDVFVVPYKPIGGLIPPMGEGEATWPATAVSLISGDQDAVLVDAVLTPEDAGRVVDWIRATGKNLTTIYITHGHHSRRHQDLHSRLRPGACREPFSPGAGRQDDGPARRSR